jgi:predicted metal-dependent peptidase
MGKIYIVRDTSGSVYDEQLAAFMSEARAIKERLNPSEMQVVDFDTSIRSEYSFTRDQQLPNLLCTGRGGTDLHCVFEFYKTKPPELLIIFSDLWCDEVTEIPDYPVIFVCVDNPRAKVHFGELIHLDV